MKKIKNLLKDTKKYLVNFKKNKTILTQVVIFFISLSISLPLLIKPMIAEGDAYVRSYLAFEDFQDQRLFKSYGGTWLPFHKIIIGLPLYIYNNYFLTPRLITLIISSLTVCLIYILSIELFKNYKQKKIIALITVGIFLLFPQRIFLSTQTLTEPVFTFFFILGIYLLIKNKLLTSTIFLNISHGIRYESWFLTPIIFYYLYINKKISIKQKVLYGSSLLLFPTYWFLLNLVNNGSGLAFFSEKYQIAQNAGFIQEYWNFPLSFNVWLNNSFDLIGLIGLISLVQGIIFYAKNKKTNTSGIFFLSTSIYLFSLLVLQVFMGTMEWFPHRYLYIPLTLFFPFIAYGLLITLKKINKKNLIIFLALLPITLIDIFYVYQHTHIISAPDMKYPIDKEKKLNEILYFYKKISMNENDITLYIYKEDENSWLYPHFVYFNQVTEESIPSIEIEDLKNKVYLNETKNYYFVFEKPAFTIIKKDQFGQEIFSNSSFSITNLKNDK
ncbi:MAG: hypothetical protein ACOZAK_04360 [Patescibacteria group bacterium]